MELDVLTYCFKQSADMYGKYVYMCSSLFIRRSLNGALTLVHSVSILPPILPY
jgi:hypothetical protein